MLLLAKLERRTADSVNAAIISLLAPETGSVYTITSDNGRKFVGFKQIVGDYADYYFADAYASCQRGTNENTNGLIKQYFQKTYKFRTRTNEQIQTAMNKLNNRLRKYHGFRTQNEVFFETRAVALTS